MRVNVHVPDDGNPLSATEPVVTAQVGCVIVPTVGTVGGVLFTVTVTEAVLLQPVAVLVLVTV